MSDYASAAEIKSYMPDVIQAATTSYDTHLAVLATVASRLVDRLLGHEDNAFIAQSTAVARYWNGNGGDFLQVDPFTTLSALAVKENDTASTYTTWTVDTDFVIGAGGDERPSWNAGYYDLLQVMPGIAKVFTLGQKTVKLTTKWGRAAAVPEIIKLATCIYAGRLLKRGQGAWQDVIGQSEQGTLQFAKQLDPDITTILRHSQYRRYEL